MAGINDAIRDSVLFTTADSIIGWSRKSALWPETFGIACCAIEMISAGCARYDLDRFGIVFQLIRPSQRSFSAHRSASAPIVSPVAGPGV